LEEARGPKEEYRMKVEVFWQQTELSRSSSLSMSGVKQKREGLRAREDEARKSIQRENDKFGTDNESSSWSKVKLYLSSKVPKL